MQTIQNQPDALCQIYSKALSELALSKGGLPLVQTLQAELAAILEMAQKDARFGEFLASRIIGPEKKKASLATIFKGRCEELTLNFLLVLCENGRLNKLGGIVAAIDDALRTAQGFVEVKVTTAAAMNDGEVATLKSRIAGALQGKQPIIKTYTDPTMIGGIRLQVGDQLLDGSIAARLRQMRDQIAAGAMPAVRAAAAKIIQD